MKTTNPKLLSLLLAAVMLFTLPLTVFAADAELTLQTENGYQFIIEETEDGPALRDVVYVGREDTYSEKAFLPETLGGLPVTPEAVTGWTFVYGHGCGAVKVSASNPYFKTVNGALYSKDGKTLVFLPNRDEEPFATVPEGVEVIGENALWYFGCVILPDSVAEIRNEDGGLTYCVIAANTGTAAEAFALENGCKFVPLNADHSHVYFRGNVLLEATCTESGKTELVCPCGASMEVETEPRGHIFLWNYDFETDTEAWHCRYCGKTPQEVFGENAGDDPDIPTPAVCGCVCHWIGNTMAGGVTGGNVLNFLRDFFYRLQIVIWRLTGTRQYCECGERHY